MAGAVDPLMGQQGSGDEWEAGREEEPQMKEGRKHRGKET